MGRLEMTKEGYPIWYEDWKFKSDMGSYKPADMSCDEWEEFCIREYGYFSCSASYGLDELFAKLGLGGDK